MQVSDEMVKVASMAYISKRMSAKDAVYFDAMQAAIQAILPHIRNEILEEASMTCFLLRHEDFNSESEDWKMGTKHCALAIRNLKDKTDE